VTRRCPLMSCTALALTLTAALAGCSSTSSSGAVGSASKASNAIAAAIASGAVAASSGGGAASVPAATGGNSVATKASGISMRVVNLYDPDNVAGPALDIYDVQLTGQKATPVATNVAYGSASAYFTPQEPTNDIGSPIVQLYALPTGEDPTTKFADATGVGGAGDDGSHAQITELLEADNGGVALPGALSRLGFSDRVEKGDDGNGGKAPVAPAAPAGQGEILVDTTSLSGVNDILFLMIDDSCAPPLNGDPNATGVPEIFAAATGSIQSSYAIFPTSAGTHQVSVVDWPQGASATCAQLTAKQGTTSVTVAAGQQIEAYVYGTSATDLHLALAPIKH
jgi:hypothetical protein